MYLGEWGMFKLKFSIFQLNFSRFLLLEMVEHLLQILLCCNSLLNTYFLSFSCLRNISTFFLIFLFFLSTYEDLVKWGTALPPFDTFQILSSHKGLAYLTMILNKNLIIMIFLDQYPLQEDINEENPLPILDQNTTTTGRLQIEQFLKQKWCIKETKTIIFKQIQTMFLF